MYSRFYRLITCLPLWPALLFTDEQVKTSKGGLKCYLSYQDNSGFCVRLSIINFELSVTFLLHSGSCLWYANYPHGRFGGI